MAKIGQPYDQSASSTCIVAFIWPETAPNRCAYAVCLAAEGTESATRVQGSPQLRSGHPRLMPLLSSKTAKGLHCRMHLRELVARSEINRIAPANEYPLAAARCGPCDIPGQRFFQRCRTLFLLASGLQILPSGTKLTQRGNAFFVCTSEPARQAPDQSQIGLRRYPPNA